MKQTLIDAFYTVAFYVFIFLCIALFASCATRTKVEYVDREVVKVQKEVVHDTLREQMHDSVFFSIVQRNDTVYNTKYIERTKYRDRIVEKYDTITKDSIIVQTKEEVVEKRVVPKWCYICLSICVVFISLTAIKILRWLKIL